MELSGVLRGVCGGRSVDGRHRVVGLRCGGPAGPACSACRGFARQLRSVRRAVPYDHGVFL
jgi:hypothetical protein